MKLKHRLQLLHKIARHIWRESRAWNHERIVTVATGPLTRPAQSFAHFRCYTTHIEESTK